MGKTAQLKLTSEQRCKAAFQKTYGFAPPAPEDERVPTFLATSAMWHGWKACWQHLEKEVMREFIER